MRTIISAWLEDSRSRFEQQDAQRRPRRDDEEYESDGDEEMAAEGDSGEDDGETEVRQQPRGRDRERGGRERFERNDRPDRGDRQARANGARREEEPEAEERIALGVLPPAIGAATALRRRRLQKPRRARKPRARTMATRSSLPLTSGGTKNRRREKSCRFRAESHRFRVTEGNNKVTNASGSIC